MNTVKGGPGRFSQTAVPGGHPTRLGTPVHLGHPDTRTCVETQGVFLGQQASRRDGDSQRVVPEFTPLESPVVRRCKGKNRCSRLRQGLLDFPLKLGSPPGHGSAGDQGKQNRPQEPVDVKRRDCAKHLVSGTDSKAPGKVQGFSKQVLAGLVPHSGLAGRSAGEQLEKPAVPGPQGEGAGALVGSRFRQGQFGEPFGQGRSIVGKHEADPSVVTQVFKNSRGSSVRKNKFVSPCQPGQNRRGNPGPVPRDHQKRFPGPQLLPHGRQK